MVRSVPSKGKETGSVIGRAIARLFSYVPPDWSAHKARRLGAALSRTCIADRVALKERL